MEGRIVIPIGNGRKIVAEKNGGEWDRELYIGVEDESGCWIQDLAIVRNCYHFDENSDSPVWEDDRFEVMVYADKNLSDYTDSFNIGLVQEAE